MLMNETLHELNDKMKSLDKSSVESKCSGASPEVIQISCGNCNVNQKNRQDFDNHIQPLSIHNQNFKCEFCSYVGIHLRDLQRHKNTMH